MPINETEDPTKHTVQCTEYKWQFYFNWKLIDFLGWPLIPPKAFLKDKMSIMYSYKFF